MKKTTLGGEVSNFTKYILLACSILILTACHKQEDFDMAGTFEATTVTVSAETNGRLLAFHLHEGDEVQAGHSAGLIDTTQLYLSRLLLVKNAGVLQTQKPNIATQIAVLEEQLRTAKHEKERIDRLVAQNAVNQKQADDVNAQIATLEKQIAAQRAQMQTSTNALDAQSNVVEVQIAQIDDQLTKCHLLAPATGMVLTTFVEQGEFVAVGKPLYRVADLRTMYLRAYATSGQVAHLQLGQTVAVTAHFGNDTNREYTGKITYISADSEFTPKNIPTDDERADLVYAIRIQVENDGYIKIGTYATVRLLSSM